MMPGPLADRPLRHMGTHTPRCLSCVWGRRGSRVREVYKGGHDRTGVHMVAARGYRLRPAETCLSETWRFVTNIRMYLQLTKFCEPGVLNRSM